MPTIGETLREARKKKGITEEAASKALKIKPQRLRDLEEDRYDTFAAPLYVRSFLKHYAKYLELDSVPLLEQLETAMPPQERKPIFQTADENNTNTPVQRHVPHATPVFALTPTGRLLLVFTILLIAFLAACFWWFYKHEGLLLKPSSPSQTARPRASVEAAIPDEPVPEQPVTLNTNAAPLRLSP
ncbi:MAG: helix-turn-helix domain-containing protein [Verrucomicrobiae bacterium]|nr:helix-turn-helix domain-containing protein [Verrucomicrobiae bacterium]